MEGRFNIENALAAITITRALGLPDDAIAAGIADVSVPGRMNVLQKDGRTVIVDYAHNFLSFTALFRSLKQDYPGAPIKAVRLPRPQEPETPGGYRTSLRGIRRFCLPHRRRPWL